MEKQIRSPTQTNAKPLTTRYDVYHHGNKWKKYDVRQYGSGVMTIAILCIMLVVAFNFPAHMQGGIIKDATQGYTEELTFENFKRISKPTNILNPVEFMQGYGRQLASINEEFELKTWSELLTSWEMSKYTKGEFISAAADPDSWWGLQLADRFLGFWKDIINTLVANMNVFAPVVRFFDFQIEVINLAIKIGRYIYTAISYFTTIELT